MMDLGLAIMLIVFTGIIMFYIGLLTPFIVIRIVKSFRLEFGEFFNEGEDEK